MSQDTMRYQPKIQWSTKSWTHNVFRFYELLFGRKVGIRAEMVTTSHNGVVTYQARSFEAMCALIETYIRELFEFKIPIKVWIPKLSPPTGLPMPDSPFMFAIAFDASASQRTDGPGNSFAHVCTGSNLILFFGNSQGNGGDHATSVTYNSVSMTQDANSPADGTVANAEMWMLVNPSTGSNTLATSSSPSASFDFGVAASYSGCAQSGQPDSSAKSTNSTTIATTVVASNCWLVGMSSNEADAGIAAAPTSSRTDRASNGDIRNNGAKQFGAVFFDSNGTVGTGSQSTTLTGTGTRWANIVNSFAPVADASTGSGLMLGGD